MLLHKHILALTAATTLATFSSPAVMAGSTGCEDSVKSMQRSCESESREEYYATQARCGSISNTQESRECILGAREERRDAVRICKEQRNARRDVCDNLEEDHYEDPLTDESIAFIDPDDIGEPGLDENPYVILTSGHTHVLRSEDYDPETDETSVELIIVHATDEAREIEGVPCRVVVDVVVEPAWDEEEGKWEFTPVEVTDDWFAQDEDENVYYCGEVARNFEDGILRDLDGSFEAGLDLAEGGYLTLAVPAPGDMHRQEYALGEAEDIVEYVSLDADPADEGIDESNVPLQFQCGAEGNTCLMTYDSTPLEPDHAEYKYYLHGTGFVLAASIEDGEINHNGAEWLVCSEDSLEAAFADGSDCGFDMFGDGAHDVREELLTELCDQHDELCADGEE